MKATATAKPALWVPGDWNAFFGFGTNILVNLLTLTGLMKFVLKMPDDLIFRRILPATGLMLFLSTVYYAWLAYRLAKRTGRTDVCALPSGISVPHMFIVTFVIMGPIAAKTGNPVKGWEAGLTWVFIQSFVLMVGGFVAPLIRRITPRAALLGTLAGVSVTFIAMRPALEMFLNPVIGFTCFAIILASWFGGVKYGKVPAGLVAIAVGTVIAWGSNLFGLNYGGLTLKGLTDSVTGFGFSLPLPALDHVFGGFEFLGVILVTAIPFGIYDLVEALDNVESAEVAGDAFPTTQVLTADGVISLIGCLMGNPFINAVYIGHPGWKAMGGRVGYSAATGLMVLVFALLGIVPVLLAAVPTVAIYPILLYIAMLIGSQAFQETPKAHAPAIVLSLVPHLAAWAVTLINGALAAAGTVVPALAAADLDKLVGNMRNEGVLYNGLHVLGGGSILGGLVFGAIAVFIIDRRFKNAAYFALAGAVMTFFGFMHGEHIGVAQSPTVAASYVLVAGVLFACSLLAARQGLAPVAEAMPAHGAGFEVLPPIEHADRPAAAASPGVAGLALAGAK
ncbi:MAG: regulator [Phycisphaerales bacterium]|nr:regulator [Phycisphaerales bacterium]